RQDVHPVALQPGRADPCIIAWKHGDFETAIAVKQRWVGAVQAQAFASDLEVRDLRAVLGCRFVLGDLQTCRIKELRQTLELLALRLVQVSKIQTRGSQKIRKIDEVIV